MARLVRPLPQPAAVAVTVVNTEASTSIQRTLYTDTSTSLCCISVFFGLHVFTVSELNKPQ